MTTIELSNAISTIDDNILCDILDERYQRLTAKRAPNPAIFIRRFSLVAAAACLITAVFTLPLFKNQPNNLPTTSPLPTTSTVQPTQSSPTPSLPTHSGGYIPAFSRPSLEEIYAMPPYDQLFPRKTLDNHIFFSSYKTEYDPIIGATNGEYLSVVFKLPSSNALDPNSLDISISASAENVRFADIENPQSYDLKLYYEEKKKNELPVEGDYFPTFLPTDISEELLEHRIYVLDDGVCKAAIKIFFADYVVSYGYTGTAITAADFYAMITSAQWFQ